MNECLFCKIISGDIPSTKIYEDADVFAFLDIHPINIGHTLVIPKQHHRNIFDVPEDLMGTLYQKVKKISLAVQKGVRADGINVSMNNEPAAGQIIFHAHVHIIPRFADDGFSHWKGKRGYVNGEEKDVAENIASHL